MVQRRAGTEREGAPHDHGRELFLEGSVALDVRESQHRAAVHGDLQQ